MDAGSFRAERPREAERRRFLKHAARAGAALAATGLGHGADYVVQDYGIAVIAAAKALASTVVDLLSNGAALGGKIASQHKAAMSTREYLNFMRGLAKEQLFDYTEA